MTAETKTETKRPVEKTIAEIREIKDILVRLADLIEQLAECPEIRDLP